MPHYDYSGEQLRTYQPALKVPDDIDEFWAATLAASPVEAPEFTPVDAGLKLVDTYDVTFAGFGGSPVKGWFHVPARTSDPVPVVIQFRGYGGGRGLAHEQFIWPVAGCANLIVDTRGQGSAHCDGDTPDVDDSGAPAHPGFMTRGILDPETYYYRRVFTDAIRSVDAALTHPLVDPNQIIVTGGSQGGGMTIAVSALHPKVRYSLVDVPFLCDFRRATSLTPKDPYNEIVRYLKVHRGHVDRAFATLSYFDGAVLGRKATAEALFSVALMDDICPPSTVYAAYNWYGGPKEIIEYAYNNHEGGQAHQVEAQLRWVNKRLA